MLVVQNSLFMAKLIKERIVSTILEHICLLFHKQWLCLPDGAFQYAHRTTVQMVESTTLQSLPMATGMARKPTQKRTEIQ